MLFLIVCCFLLVDRGLFCDSAQVYPGWACLLKGAFRGERLCSVVRSEPGCARRPLWQEEEPLLWSSQQLLQPWAPELPRV